SLDGATANAAMAAFYQRTGWRLRLQMPQPEPQTDAEQPAKETAAAIAAPQRMLDESELELRPSVAGKPINENAALAEIEEAFSPSTETWRPSRVKLKKDEKGDYLELAFMTPELGLRQKRTLQATADATGHRLRIRPHVNTFDLVEIARKLVPKEWRLLKQPGLHSDQGLVRVKVATPPSPEELAEVCER